MTRLSDSALDSVLDVWHEVCPTVNEGEETKAQSRLLVAVLTLAATVEELRRTIEARIPANDPDFLGTR